MHVVHTKEVTIQLTVLYNTTHARTHTIVLIDMFPESQVTCRRQMHIWGSGQMEHRVPLIPTHCKLGSVLDVSVYALKQNVFLLTFECCLGRCAFGKFCIVWSCLTRSSAWRAFLMWYHLMWLDSILRRGKWIFLYSTAHSRRSWGAIEFYYNWNCKPTYMQYLQSTFYCVFRLLVPK